MVQRSERLDAAFGALSDPTRRAILERLVTGDASITDLASVFDMSLTGTKKHVTILERSGLVATRKVGRTRLCSLGRRRLDDEVAWMARHQVMLESRLDRLDDFLRRRDTKGDQR